MIKTTTKKTIATVIKFTYFFVFPILKIVITITLVTLFSGRYVLCLLFKIFDHGEKRSRSLKRQTLESNPLEVNLGEVLGHTIYCSLHCQIINRCQLWSHPKPIWRNTIYWVSLIMGKYEYFHIHYSIVNQFIILTAYFQIRSEWRRGVNFK